MIEEPPDFLTVEEAGRVMRISRTKAYQLTTEWRVTAGKSGMPVTENFGVLRIPRRQLEELLGAEILTIPPPKDTGTRDDPKTRPVPDTPARPEGPSAQRPPRTTLPTAETTRPRRPRKRARASSDQLSLPFT